MLHLCCLNLNLGILIVLGSIAYFYRCQMHSLTLFKATRARAMEAILGLDVKQKEWFAQGDLLQVEEDENGSFAANVFNLFQHVSEG